MNTTHFINHIAFVVDASGSMSSHKRDVVKAFDAQIAYLKRRSIELDQETRVSVYTFGSRVSNVVFDQDVMRTKPIADAYVIDGQTALIDATLKAIEDSKKLPELYGDHAFLVYVLTDGEENHSRAGAHDLAAVLNRLPEHWTIAVQVPNAMGIHEAKRFGFPAGNIAVWDTVGAQGVEHAVRAASAAIDTYMTQRAAGVRGTRSFFSPDTTKLTKTAVVGALDALKSHEYQLLPVSRDIDIKTFVESWNGVGTYRPGSAYYQLMKPETVQAYKQIALVAKRNGMVYTGDKARGMLGLPAHELRVSPATSPDWHVYVQSTSSNRKLIAGTNLLVLK